MDRSPAAHRGYARKYALNGLFLIDDKDADSQDNSEQGQKAKPQPAKPFDLPAALEWVKKAATVEQVKQRASIRQGNEQRRLNSRLVFIFFNKVKPSMTSIMISLMN